MASLVFHICHPRLSGLSPSASKYSLTMGTCSPRRDCQGELLRKYSFKCTCPSCSLSLAESTSSDRRRAVLKRTLLTSRTCVHELLTVHFPNDHTIDRV